MKDGGNNGWDDKGRTWTGLEQRHWRRRKLHCSYMLAYEMREK